MPRNAFQEDSAHDFSRDRSEAVPLVVSQVVLSPFFVHTFKDTSFLIYIWNKSACKLQCLQFFKEKVSFPAGAVQHVRRKRHSNHIDFFI